MEAIRRQVQADEQGGVRVTGLFLEPGQTVDVLITSPADLTQRKTALSEMRLIMAEAGQQANKTGLDEKQLKRILSDD